MYTCAYVDCPEFRVVRMAPYLWVCRRYVVLCESLRILYITSHNPAPLPKSRRTLIYPAHTSYSAKRLLSGSRAPAFLGAWFAAEVLGRGRSVTRPGLAARPGGIPRDTEGAADSPRAPIWGLWYPRGARGAIAEAAMGAGRIPEWA